MSNHSRSSALRCISYAAYEAVCVRFSFAFAPFANGVVDELEKGRERSQESQYCICVNMTNIKK